MTTADNEITLDDLPETFRDIAEVIGLDAAMALVRHCGGQSPYIPKMDSCQRSAKYRQIYEEYKQSKSSCVYAELSRKYDLSESHVRAIVRTEHSRRYPSPVQSSLFS